MIADIVTTFMNSDRKNSANRIPEYSVLKPPTSSCSASTRSNGGRFSSAVTAMRKTTNGTIPVEMTFQSTRLFWRTTIPAVDNVPDESRTAARLSPSAAS